MTAWITQLRKGILEYAILLMLEGKENYALNVVRCLKEYSCFQVSESTVYPILGRLKNEGKLSARIARTSEGPPRRYLSLAEDGKKQLNAMKDYLQEVNKAIAELEKGQQGER